MTCLENYAWPGNVRELENIVERAILTAEDFTITESDWPPSLQPDELQLAVLSEDKTLKEILESVEKAVILKPYEKHKTTTAVAKALGISQPSASLKVQKYLNKDSVLN